jgi:hypothetical protein
LPGSQESISKVTEKKMANQTRATARINSKLNKSLAAYVTAASAAGVSILALGQSAEAKIIYTSTYLQLAGNVFLDVNHDGIYDLPIRGSGFCISQDAGSLCGNFFALNASSYGKGRFMGAPGFGSALFAGAKIGPASPFSAIDIIGSDFFRGFSGTNGAPNWFGPFANGGKGVRDRYLGFKFTIGKQAHYGWLRITVHIPNSEKAGYSAVVTGYAYETTPNTAIIAGQKSRTAETSSFVHPELAAPDTVGEPASLGVLARGADTLAIWRREEDTATQ